MDCLIRKSIAIGLLAAFWLLSSCGAPATQVPSGAATTPAHDAIPSPETEVVQVSGGSYRRISAIQLADMLRHKDFVLINTHIPYEGEIDATDIFLPYNQIGEQLGKIPADKQAKILLYCRSGGMSAIAAETLVKAGYTNIWDLQGGMAAWQRAGQPITTK